VTVGSATVYARVVPEAWTNPPTDDVAAADERATLMTFLDYQRAILARKADGLTDQQARRTACPPSDMTILGLVRHMTDVDKGWSQRAVLGADVEPIYYGNAHPDGDADGDFHPPTNATLDDALTTYWDVIAESSRIFAAAALDDIEANTRATYSVRWILVHLVEEYARHCGHADLLRQAIDGATGD
jgi:hypothetical protein